MEFKDNDVQYAINKKCKDGDNEVLCTVVKSNNSNIRIGDEQSFELSVAHSLVLDRIKTLRK